MKLSLQDNLPFISITIAYHGKTLEIPHVLVDTGSASTVLSADIVAAIEITPSPEDVLYSIRGVGGSEAVFARQLDYLQIGGKRLSRFTAEVGVMDYGFEINGILGMDSLTRAGAIINLAEAKMEFA